MSTFTPLSQSTSPLIAADHVERNDWSVLQTLTEKLRVIEQRLGTPDEQVDDERLACELGHDIRNRLNLLQMREEFRKMMLSKESGLQQTA